MQQSTKYYTIAGNWSPFLLCPLRGFENQLYYELQRLNQGSNDDILPLWSARELPHYIPLKDTNDCHTGLLGDDEYELSQHILIGV
jgi:hypothetical protein